LEVRLAVVLVPLPPEDEAAWAAAMAMLAGWFAAAWDEDGLVLPDAEAGSEKAATPAAGATTGVPE